MPSRTSAAVPTLTRVDQPRDVYRSQHKVHGEWVYYAVTSTGFLIDARRPRVGETDAEVVAGLADLLDQLDTPRPSLTLLPRAVAPVSSTLRSWLLCLRPVRRVPSQSPPG